MQAGLARWNLGQRRTCHRGSVPGRHSRICQAPCRCSQQKGRCGQESQRNRWSFQGNWQVWRGSVLLQFGTRRGPMACDVVGCLAVVVDTVTGQR